MIKNVNFFRKFRNYLIEIIFKSVLKIYAVILLINLININLVSDCKFKDQFDRNLLLYTKKITI